MIHRVGFLINPIAGLGGRVGLKGTDGVVEEALALGAKPAAPERARVFLQALKGTGPPSIEWVTASGMMGAALLPRARVVHRVKGRRSTRDDTIATAERCLEAGVEVVVFVGGDGTARDVAEAAQRRVPILGVPSGVKMYSGVFGVDPPAAARVLSAFLRGDLGVGDAELLDLDEEAYRRGDWKPILQGSALTPTEPNLVQRGKEGWATAPEADFIEAMAHHVGEMMDAEPETLFIMGPGTTLASVAQALALPKSLLGVDAYLARRVLGLDIGEAALLELLQAHPRTRLLVSPIGAQGFVLGRGNLQLSPAVLRRVGLPSLVVVATPSKLRGISMLRVDTGDVELDAEFRSRRYLPVLVAYRTQQLHPLG